MNNSKVSTEIANVLQASEQPLLEDWIANQLADDAVRLDLLDERSLRRESKEFLHLLRHAVTGSESLDAPEWADMLEFLGQLSTSRDRAGFTPTETATFVLSFKRPLMRHVLERGSLDHEQLWGALSLLDRLALHTTEIYRTRRESVISRQREEMVELSTPVVQLWDGILGLPLIGTLDTARTQTVMETLLATIAYNRAEIAILDITGVPAIDTQMAQHLLKTVAAARLMGAECIISGIRPQIAQTMIELEINLGEVRTRATMAEALALAFEQRGIRVSRGAD